MKLMTFFIQKTALRDLIVLLVLIIYAITCPSSAQASPDLKKLGEFIEEVRNGNAAEIRGLYIQNLMAAPVIQQPHGYPEFVSRQTSAVTNFASAEMFGNIGLLAHNTLAGRDFFNILWGSQMTLIYGDGSTKTFMVDKILSYQILPDGQYLNLKSRSIENANEIFNRVYGGDFHVTLQTCIAKDDQPDWGRLFIIATPLK